MDGREDDAVEDGEEYLGHFDNGLVAQATKDERGWLCLSIEVEECAQGGA
jgi:hypothetical protein